MKTGTTVRLKTPVLQGEVKRRRINEATDATELLVQWSEGETTHERWIDEDQLEAVPTQGDAA